MSSDRHLANNTEKVYKDAWPVTYQNSEQSLSPVHLISCHVATVVLILERCIFDLTVDITTANRPPQVVRLRDVGFVHPIMTLEELWI